MQAFTIIPREYAGLWVFRKGLVINKTIFRKVLSGGAHGVFWPFIFCLLKKRGTHGVFWPLLFAKAQCDVCFTFKSSSHSGKKKKRKERLHTPVNILYELFLVRGNCFCEGNQSIELLVSLKKDSVFPSRY